MNPYFFHIYQYDGFENKLINIDMTLVVYLNQYTAELLNIILSALVRYV